MPVDELLDQAPLPGSMPDPLAKEVENHPEQDGTARDARHGAKGVDVAGLFDPRVGVEGEKETKSSYGMVESACR